MSSMNTVVISLERTPERLAAFHSRNAKIIPYTRFVAVDGAQLMPPGLKISDYVAEPAHHHPGEVGNALSHLLLWEGVRGSGEAITICEDDAMLHTDFIRQARRCMEALPANWDMVFWGWNFDAVLSVDVFPGLCRGAILTSQPDMRANAEQYLVSDMNASLHKVYNLFGTFCYSVSPKGAAELLRRLCPIRIEKIWIPSLEQHVLSRTIDVAMNKHMRDMACYVAMPPLALTMNDHGKSTVIVDSR